MRRKRPKINLVKVALFIGFLPIIIPILIIILLFKMIQKLIKNKKNKVNIENDDNSTYHKKELLTDCEKQFMERLKTIFGNKYIIQPQVPLRMIISKDGDELGKYANELHKYIDFGLFDNDYQLLALVELNDKSHTLQERHKRDLKVQDICNQANIPLITFWTNENYTNDNIRHTIEKEIENAKRKTN